MTNHAHIQKFCGKLMCNNDLYSKLFLKTGVSPMTDYIVIRQLTAVFANEVGYSICIVYSGGNCMYICMLMCIVGGLLTVTLYIIVIYIVFLFHLHICKLFGPHWANKLFIIIIIIFTIKRASPTLSNKN